MDRSPLVVGLAAVFAGMTVLLFVLAAVFRDPVILFIAVPFAGATYLFWYHASGRIREARPRAGQQARAGGRTPQGQRVDPGEGTRREAYRTLGLDQDADESAVKRAYREKVKDVHPDRGGDEEEFKRVTRAYERLTD